MKGSVTQDRRRGLVDGKPWFRIRVYVGLDPATHKPRYREQGIRGTKREAEKAKRDLIRQIEEGGAHRGTKGTVAFALDEWYELKSSRWSLKTRDTARWVIDTRLVPALGSIPLHRLGAADIDGFYTAMARQGLGPASIRKAHNTLSAALNQALKWGWIPSNPCRQASPPPVDTPDILPPSVLQVAKLIEAAHARNPELAALLMLSAATGARRGEICALRRGSVDLDAEPPMVSISHSIVQVRRVWEVKEPKTKESRRRIAIDAVTATLLGAHLEAMNARAEAAGVEMDPNPYVFSDRPSCSLPWMPDRVTRSFTRLRAQTGATHVRLHDLRHAHVTGLLTAGIDVRTVAGRVGHRNAAVTLSVYSHFLPVADQGAAEMYGKLRAAETKEAPPSPGEGR